MKKSIFTGSILAKFLVFIPVLFFVFGFSLSEVQAAYFNGSHSTNSSIVCNNSVSPQVFVNWVDTSIPFPVVDYYVMPNFSSADAFIVTNPYFTHTSPLPGANTYSIMPRDSSGGLPSATWLHNTVPAVCATIKAGKSSSGPWGNGPLSLSSGDILWLDVDQTVPSFSAPGNMTSCTFTPPLSGAFNPATIGPIDSSHPNYPATTGTTYTISCDRGAAYPLPDRWASDSITVFGAASTGVPLPPTGLTATPAACNSGTINLSWNAVTGATSYDLRDGASVIYSSLNTSYPHTGLVAGSSHNYSVRVTNASGPSVFSTVVPATATSCPPPPPPPPSGLPDLIARSLSPSTVTAGTPFTYSAVIENLSATTGTGASFFNYFQTATAWDGGGTITPHPASSMGILGPSGSASATSPSLTFPVSGSRSVRACADTTGVIAESNDGNNCSAWLNVTVVGTPDLVPSAPSIPSSATVGTSIPLSVTLGNNGTSETSALTPFDSAFEVATAANGGGTRSNILPVISLVLGAQSSANWNTASHTFSSIGTGTYSIRACMDITSVIGEGANEGNNCTGWTNVNVTGGASMSGTLSIAAATPSPCTILSGQSSCSVNLNWSITNPIATPTAITASGMTNINVSNSLATPQSGTQAVIVPYSSRNFFLYNNGTSLVNPPTGVPVSAVCTAGTAWSGTACMSYTVTASISGAANGSIALPLVRTVADGAQTTYSITANASYNASMGGTCGGAPASGTGTFNYITSPVTANCTVVVTFTSMSGTLLPATSSCTILLNGNSCPSPVLNWTTTNPVGTSAVTNNGTATPASAPGNNSSSTFTVPYNNAMGGVTTFYLHNSSLPLAQSTVTTSCAPNVWSTVSNTCVASAPGSAELSSGPLISNPTSPVVGTNTIFSAVITNTGGASTGVSFPNSFEFDNDSDHSTVVATVSVNAGPISPSGTATPVALAPDAYGSLASSPPHRKAWFAEYASAYTFPTGGQWYVNFCADSINMIPETNESDNCSGWTSVTVLPPSSSTGPDLTILPAGNPTPTTAVQGTAQTYTAIITNIGSASTGAPFPYYFERNTQSGGSGVPTFVSTRNRAALASGASSPASGAGAVTASMSFPTPGVKSIRVCADKANSAGGGVITEPDPAPAGEANNCSTWTDVTVFSGALMPSVSLVANPPAISIPNSSTLTWSSTNLGAAGDYCTSKFFAGSGPTSDSTGIVVSPIVTTTYNISCVQFSSGVSVPDVFTVTVGTPGSKTPIYIEN